MKSITSIQLLTRVAFLMAVGGWSFCGVARGADTADAGLHAASPAASPDPSLDKDRGGGAPSSEAHTEKAHRLSPETKPNLDRSGRTRVGKASFYAKMFAGRTMADGTPMEPTGNNAASRTLPLGTTAKVTNLETGKTAVVTIRDRGPYVAGRIVDLSPATARQIGLDKRTGVTKVKVAPIAVPLANGAIRFGDGVLQASNLPDGQDHLGAGEQVESRTGLP